MADLRERLAGLSGVLTAKADRRTVIRGGLATGLAGLASACGIGQSNNGPDTSPRLATASAVASPSGADTRANAAPPTASATATAGPARTAAPTGPSQLSTGEGSPTPAPTPREGEGAKTPNPKDKAPLPEAFRVPKENGKFRTFDRAKVVIDGKEIPVLLSPDLGSLGPDTDTLFGVDLPGDVDTEGIEVISTPGSGKVTETRVIGRRRDDLKYVQFRDILGGDAFEEIEVMKFGGDEGAKARDRRHAALSGHTHQKVVYIGDLGLFEKQYGENPRIRAFLQRLIRAQVPPRAGIPESNFVISKV